jgi:putative ABC transport system ATP-binding protein
MAVVFGSSGSGKSTLLMMLGGMMKPSEGKVLYDGESIYDWSYAKQKKYRSLKVGFIFQKFFLLPYLSVKDNVLISTRVGDSIQEKKGSINELANRFGLENRLDHKPGELSVGEQQRVALMRALIRNPDIILADEPTGNLDPENTDIVSKTLHDETNAGRIVIVVTHNQTLDKNAHVIYRINKGVITKT